MGHVPMTSPVVQTVKPHTTLTYNSMNSEGCIMLYVAVNDGIVMVVHTYGMSGPWPTRPLSARSHHPLLVGSLGAAKNGQRDLKAEGQVTVTIDHIGIDRAEKDGQNHSPSNDRFRIIASILSSLPS